MSRSENRRVSGVSQRLRAAVAVGIAIPLAVTALASGAAQTGAPRAFVRQGHAPARELHLISSCFPRAMGTDGQASALCIDGEVKPGAFPMAASAGRRLVLRLDRTATTVQATYDDKRLSLRRLSEHLYLIRLPAHPRDRRLLGIFASRGPRTGSSPQSWDGYWAATLRFTAR